MTIVAARRYREGNAQELDLGADHVPCQDREFDWIGLVDPSAAEMEQMRARYALHPLAIEDALTPRHAPKAEAYGQQLFVIARTIASGNGASAKGDEIDYGQTAIFLGRHFIVTVRLGSARAHSQLREQLEHFPERLGEGPDFVLHAVLAFIVSGYDPVLDPLEERVGTMEDGAIDRFPDQARIRRIFRLRRSLRRLEGVLGRMEEMGGKLAQVDQPSIDIAARPYFRDVHDAMKRVIGRVRGLLDTLGYILEVAALLEQNRQGQITRQLAAWAAILGVTTAIAGIYGMNFQFMPELEWRYGYFLVVGVTAAVCIGLWLKFKRAGWL